jgi:hypothetical protein
MASINIVNVSTPNDGLGDPLRVSQVKANDNFAELNAKKVEVVLGKELSENNYTDAEKAKLASIDLEAQVNVQPDWLQADNTKDDFIKNKPDYLNAVGSAHYADLATQTNPISVAANVDKKLTNDANGGATDTTELPYGVTSLYNSATNQLDFSQLSVGDLVTFQSDLTLDTSSADQVFSVYLKIGIGSATQKTIPMTQGQVKTTSSFRGVREVSFDITADIKDYPAEIWILTDKSATVEVNQYFFKVLRKNINIVDILTDLGYTPENVTNKSNSYTASSTTTYPNTKALVDGLATKATDSNVVHKTGNEVVNGKKDFTERVKIARTLTDLDYHAYDDNTIINVSSASPVAGYASYDTYVTNNSSLLINHFTGYQSRFQNLGTGNVLSATGLHVDFHNDGTIQKFIGVSIANPTGTGTITDKIGLVIGDFSDGYAIFIEDGLSYFGGKLLVNTLIDNGLHSLQIVGDALIDGKIETLKGNFGNNPDNDRTVNIDGYIRITTGNGIEWGWGGINIKGDNDSQIIKFHYANGITESMRIDNDKLLIGTTTNNGVDKLQVNGTVSASPATLDSQLATFGQVKTTVSPTATYNSTATLSNSQLNKVLIVGANITVTIPNTGLVDDFECSFVVRNTFTLTLALAGGVTTILNAGLTCTNGTFTVKKIGSTNEYVIRGDI